MRLAWVTDIHLNFVDAAGLAEFLDSLLETEADALAVGGDIGEAPDVAAYLETIADTLQRPIYFVLGNHDFYRGSIAGVRSQIRKICGENERLVYLSDSPAIELSSQTAILGHDGFGDGRAGDYAGSDVTLNDSYLIQELAAAPDKFRRLPLLQALGDEAAEHIRDALPPALEQYEHVVLLTHVPPFRQACWYEGRPSDDNWAPYFVCQALGEAVLDILPDFPHRRMTLLCGHTHGEGICRPLPNLTVHTGGAVYRYPRVQQVFEPM